MTETHEITYFNTSTNGLNEGIQRDIAINLNPPRQNLEVLTSNCNRSTVPGVTVWLRKHNGFDMSELRAHIGSNGTITDKGGIVEITMPNALYLVSMGAVNFFTAVNQGNDGSIFAIGHRHVIRIEGSGKEVRQNMSYQWMESKQST